LEYYRGVLFLTTNRGCTVDDAIVSRLTARFKYQKPSRDEQEQLWAVLSKQNGIEIPTAEINKIIEALPHLSGRDIKNLLKMAYVMSTKTGEPISAKMLSGISKFKQTEDEGEET
jgi:AAA+ superfamily predicted ATPase